MCPMVCAISKCDKNAAGVQRCAWCSGSSFVQKYQEMVSSIWGNWFHLKTRCGGRKRDADIEERVREAMAPSPSQRIVRCYWKCFRTTFSVRGIVHLVYNTDKATFHVSGRVNTHNLIIWGTKNPHVPTSWKRQSRKWMSAVELHASKCAVLSSLQRKHFVGAHIWTCSSSFSFSCKLMNRTMPSSIRTVHRRTGPLRCVDYLTKISMKIGVVVGTQCLASQSTRPGPTWCFRFRLRQEQCVRSITTRH
jgi:hypothetical protein